MKLVIDTNILISALVKDGFTREFIINQNFKFELISPAYVFSEIAKYKQDILKKTKISEEEFYFLLTTLMKYISVINPFYYNLYLNEANEIIGHIHITDVPFLAVALAFHCPVWSDDNHFQKQKKVKVLTTKDIVKLGK